MQCVSNSIYFVRLKLPMYRYLHRPHICIWRERKETTTKEQKNIFQFCDFLIHRDLLFRILNNLDDV